jgi:integral membrane protein (TIGR01906 family)
LAVLPLLGPWFVHPALDAAGSAGRLGLASDETHALSDQSVRELVLGPGDFGFDGPDGTPFYGPEERAHMGDARLLLGLCLAAGGVSLLGLALTLVRRPEQRRLTWKLIARSGLVVALAVVVLGVLSSVAFDSLFTLFHRLAFPGGNWTFDPQTQRLVQLYPFGFWQIAAAALGALMMVLGLGAWIIGRRLGREPSEGAASGPTRPVTSG